MRVLRFRSAQPVYGRFQGCGRKMEPDYQYWSARRPAVLAQEPANFPAGLPGPPRPGQWLRLRSLSGAGTGTARPQLLPESAAGVGLSGFALGIVDHLPPGQALPLPPPWRREEPGPHLPAVVEGGIGCNFKAGIDLCRQGHHGFCPRQQRPVGLMYWGG